MNAPTQVGRSDRSRGSVRDLFEQGERLRADLRALGDAAAHLTRGWQSLVRDRMERRPYATLAAAAGVGYVLGAGSRRHCCASFWPSVAASPSSAS